MANLITRNYQAEFGRIRKEIDRMQDDLFTWCSARGSCEWGDWKPPIDVFETDEEIILLAEVPGMDLKDIDVSINEKHLIIKGERKNRGDEENMSYYRRERRYGTFTRSFDLPVDVSADKIKGEYQNGVIKLNLPKRKDQSDKKVEVKAS